MDWTEVDFEVQVECPERETETELVLQGMGLPPEESMFHQDERIWVETFLNQSLRPEQPDGQIVFQLPTFLLDGFPQNEVGVGQVSFFSVVLGHI